MTVTMAKLKDMRRTILRGVSLLGHIPKDIHDESNEEAARIYYFDNGVHLDDDIDKSDPSMYNTLLHVNDDIKVARIHCNSHPLSGQVHFFDADGNVAHIERYYEDEEEEAPPKTPPRRDVEEEEEPAPPNQKALFMRAKEARGSGA